MARWIAVLLVLTLAAPALAKKVPAGDAAPAAAASNRFGVDLYAALSRTKGNLFFSPYSVSVALVILRKGALGSTRSQMDRVMSLASVRAAHGHRALAAALLPQRVRDGGGDAAKLRPTHELHIANALWGQEGLAFEKPFLGRLDGSFGAPLECIDFTKAAAARARINGWVAENTKQRIRDIIPG
ncbi:MAG: serpin family protein, partial [Phycisphaeraceae bacterium]|nr:serpin family protein [Phycisphaeraceae bacterium]